MVADHPIATVPEDPYGMDICTTKPCAIMKRTFPFLVVYTWMLIGVIALPVQAQDFGGLSNVNASGVAYHEFARTGEVTIEVLVLSSGGGGIYVLGAGTTLDQLLALTGGVATSSTSPTYKSRVMVRLFREVGNQRELVYESELNRMLTESGNYPALQDGDVFTTEVITRQRMSWREIFFTFTSILSAALVIERITRR